MVKHRDTFDGDDQIAALREELAALKEYIRVLTDTIEGVRQELQWLARKGLPLQEPLPATPILTRIPAAPFNDDSDENPVIANDPPASAELPATMHGAPLLEEMDAVEFMLHGEEQFGEIVSLDHARGEATVLLIPAHKQVVVPQNILTRADFDEGDDEALDDPQADRAAVPPALAEDERPPAPPLDKPFTRPDSQGRLFQ